MVEKIAWKAGVVKQAGPAVMGSCFQSTTSFVLDPLQSAVAKYRRPHEPPPVVKSIGRTFWLIHFESTALILLEPTQMPNLGTVGHLILQKVSPSQLFSYV